MNIKSIVCLVLLVSFLSFSSIFGVFSAVQKAYAQAKAESRPQLITIKPTVASTAAETSPEKNEDVITQKIESIPQTTLSGTLIQIMVDVPEVSNVPEVFQTPSGSRYAIQTSDSNLVPLEFTQNNIDESLRNGYIQVRGTWNTDSSFQVTSIISSTPQSIRTVVRSEVETLDAAGNPMKIETLGPQLTTGTRNTLVIPVSFTDVPPPDLSITQIRDVLYDGPSSVNAQFEFMSKGNFELGGSQGDTPDVLNWITLPRTSDNCPSNMTGSWTTQAKNMARVQGFEPNDYRSVVLIFPAEIPSCNSWGGQATIGTIGSTSDTGMVWLQYQSGLDLMFLRSMFIHELGHNLGLVHSSAVSHCQAQAAIPEGCTSIEYGDHFSPMGDTPRFLRSYNNFNLEQLGWLSPGSKVTNLPQAGTYTLTLFSPATPHKGNQVVSFPLKNINGVPTGQSVYLEFRRTIAPLEIFTGDNFQNVTKGVSVRFAPSNLTAQTNSYLLDTTGTPSEIIDDPAIMAGRTYQNSMYDFSISTISTNPILGARFTLRLGR